MNVLEKILEEIDNRKSYHEEKAYKQDDYEIQKMYCSEELDWITNIIRSHMNDIENDGWIPVEERLPEEDERYKGRKVIDVLVTTAKWKVTKVQRQSHNGYWWWGRIYGEPTAWQPLPESYKGANYNG